MQIQDFYHWAVFKAETQLARIDPLQRRHFQPFRMESISREHLRGDNFCKEIQCYQRHRERNFVQEDGDFKRGQVRAQTSM
jgi:hypothetical protein